MDTHSIIKSFKRLFAWEMSSERKLRVNSIVTWTPKAQKFNQTNITRLADKFGKVPNIFSERHFIFLGEIIDMRGHGIFAGGRSGKIYFGYHIEDFQEVDQNGQESSY